MKNRLIGALACLCAPAAFGSVIPPEFEFWNTFENSNSLRSIAETPAQQHDISIEGEGLLPPPNNIYINGPATAVVENRYSGDLLFDMRMQAVSPAFVDHASSFAWLQSKLDMQIVVPEGWSHAIFQFYQLQSYAFQGNAEGAAAHLQSTTQLSVWGDVDDFYDDDTKAFHNIPRFDIHGEPYGSNDVKISAYAEGATHIQIRQSFNGSAVANAAFSESRIWAPAVRFRVTYFKYLEDTSGYSVTYDGTSATAEDGYVPDSWTTGLIPYPAMVPEPSAWWTSALGLAVLASRKKPAALRPPR